MKSTLLFTSLVLFLALPKAFGSAADQIDGALTISKSWVSQIDAGKYDESYAFACGAMHDKVTQDRWEMVLKSLRAPWGPVTERKQLSHVYKPNGFEGNEGEFVVITYDTSFQKSVEAKEIVVLKWEDGKWRGAGYNAEAKPAMAADSTPETTTETQTADHVKPKPQ